jgi:hypothetical protein
MKPTLSVLDPLAAREMAINITMPPSDEPRDDRTASNPHSAGQYRDLVLLPGEDGQPAVISAALLP